MKFKPLDIVIDFNCGKVYEVKYVIGNKVIVTNGIFDFPLYPNEFTLYSPLLEELL